MINISDDEKRGENTEARRKYRSGCNQALVHYYFRTKDNLFEKIFEEKVRFIVTNFLNINSEAQTLEDKIRKMVDVHFEFFRSNPRLVPFVLTEVLSDMERFGFMFDRRHWCSLKSMRLCGRKSKKGRSVLLRH